MRTFVVEKGAHTFKSLGTLLLGNMAGSASAIDRLKALNPHVDFKKIEPGTVLLIPDLPGSRGGAGPSVTGDTFDALCEDLLASVKAAAGGVSRGYDAWLRDQKEVAAMMRSSAVKRALEADPELKGQVDAAMQVFKDDQQQAKATDEALKALQQQAAAELAKLAKTLDGS